MDVYKRKKAEPFDAYLEFGYRQVTIIATSTKQPTPYDVSLLSACSRYVNDWRYSTLKNKSKSSISISISTNRNAIL